MVVRRVGWKRERRERERSEAKLVLCCVVTVMMILEQHRHKGTFERANELKAYQFQFLLLQQTRAGLLSNLFFKKDSLIFLSVAEKEFRT
jgi:hypothetical protein